MEKVGNIIVECRKIFEDKGAGAVYEFLNLYFLRNPNSNIVPTYCTQCETNTLHFVEECLICGTLNPYINVQDNVQESNVQETKEMNITIKGLGKRLNTVGELRKLMQDLDDHDQICIEACDKDGEVEDLYPMYLDVIDNVRLVNNTIVREVRFCQMPNVVKPDPICNCVIRDMPIYKEDGKNWCPQCGYEVL